MELYNERYRVVIDRLIGTDTAGYDLVYNSRNRDNADLYMTLSIHREDRSGRLLRIALLATLQPHSDYCALLEGEILTVLQFDTILRIGLKDGSIVQCADCDCFGGNLQIHPIPGGYIIYGEMDIAGFDSNLKQLWMFHGRDIFALPTGDRAFWIADKQIHCRDWEGCHYVLDFEGHLISETHEMSPGS